jgi:hypothetical protein
LIDQATLLQSLDLRLNLVFIVFLILSAMSFTDVDLTCLARRFLEDLLLESYPDLNHAIEVRRIWLILAGKTKAADSGPCQLTYQERFQLEYAVTDKLKM